MAGTAEAFFGAGGIFERVDRLDRAGEDWDGDHLGDFVAGADFERGVAEVGHEDEDLPSVAGIDDAGGGGDSFGSHGGPVTDQQAERCAGGWMAGFDGDAGADADGGLGGEDSSVQGEEVVAEVFAGMGDDGSAGRGVEELDAEHEFYRRALEGIGGHRNAGAKFLMGGGGFQR